MHPNKKTAGFRRNDHVRPCRQRKGPKPRVVYEGRMANGAVMSDEFHFNGEDDAKAEIRAAVRYLLEGTPAATRVTFCRRLSRS